MPNTFTKIYVHIVFSTKNREQIISKEWEDDLYRYITGIIQKRNCKLYAIGGMPDHIHIFISMNPDIQLSYLVRDIKASSSKHINENNLCIGKFSWQIGYSAFSYSESQIDKVCKYILNQHEHHLKKTFKEEYISLLQAFKIEYDEKYVFDGEK
jgi:putative transposase